VVTFSLKPGQSPQVIDAIKEVNAAIQKSHWPAKPAGWYQLLNGGEGPVLVLASARNNWAEFQPPEKDLGSMLAGVYGKDGAQALFDKFYKNLRTVRTEIFRYRPDLSYLPAQR
jgi:hypothetical protein